MAEATQGDWLSAALGAHRERIEHEIMAALCEAHTEAVRSHDQQGSKANDTYGTTMWVRQHEILNDRLRAVPGIVFRKPAGERSRFDFPVVEASNTVIVPIRFSTEPRLRHDQVQRINLSDLRLALLAGLAPPREPDLFDAVSDGDYEVNYQEAVHAQEQLERAGRAVVVGFGSTPAGIFETGLGDMIIDDAERGAISWRRWHPLPVYAGLDSIPSAPQLRVVEPPAPVERFDAGHETDDVDFGYRIRSIGSGAPDPEKRGGDEPVADTEGSSS
jgi:hypothetical protein